MAVNSERRAGLAQTRPAPRASRGFEGALGVGLLAVIPLAVGTPRLIQLAGGPAVIPADPRFDAFPVALVLRLLFLGVMAFSLVRGLTAIRERDIANHRAWMMRAYALALGAGTQVVTEGIAGAVLGHAILVGDLAKGAGWVVNLRVAEWLIRRPALTTVARGRAR